MMVNFDERRVSKVSEKAVSLLKEMSSVYIQLVRSTIDLEYKFAELKEMMESIDIVSMKGE